jgi:glycosyltransferase involved in cell wall biosynthesis
MPKVSIVMPCYNDGKYIEESINSILKQTYKNVELIIINDGSTDEYTNELISKSEWPNTVLLKSNRLRPAGARNLGIEKASGKYILPLDADDIIDPTYIEKAVTIMEKNEHIGVVYCKADLFGEQNGIWDLPSYSLDKMLLDNIVFVTALFRKEDWSNIGGFNTCMKHGMEDYDFWLSILEIGRDIYQIPEVLFHYRIKPTSRTTEFQKNMDVVVETYTQIYDNHPILYKEHQELYAKILRKELIHQIFLSRTLKQSIGYLEKISKIPYLKKIYNKIIKNKQGE